jgi:hypothetical protein
MSSSEAVYESKMVSELDKYMGENLTPSDCLLRMSLDANNQVQLMRQ